MANSRFWGSSQKQNIIPGSNKNEIMKKDNKFSKIQNMNNKSKKIAKKFGFTGIVVVAVLLAVLSVGYVFFANPILKVYAAAKVLKEDVDQIGSALKERDLVELDRILTKAEEDLSNVKKVRDKNIGWMRNLRLFKIKEFYSDSDKFVSAGYHAVDALKEISTIIAPFSEAGGFRVEETDPEVQIDEEEGLREAFQTWISLMPEVAAQLDGVIAKVTLIGEELESINVDKYPEKIRGVPIRQNVSFIKNSLSQADDYAPDLKEALTLFPQVLGVSTPVKRYMIIMQNDKEIRPTGGFMTGYATFRMQDAWILNQDFSSHDMYTIDNTLDIIDATYDFPDAPEAYMKYLKVERWYARDMNASADFAESMDQFLTFYNMAGRLDPVEIKPIDGIIAIDTNVISRLLEVTGPVTVNGITYTAENVILELERIASLTLREQVGRKRVLGDLMKAMLTKVFESDSTIWPDLIDTITDLGVKKHMLVYLPDFPEAQALINKYGFGGEVKEEVLGDYAMVVQTNLGGDKTNWFVNKKVTHSLINNDGKWMREIKIDYTYPRPSEEYSPFVARFRDWVRVYVPAGSEFITVDGTEDGTLTDQESNKTWFSGYIELGPDESKSMTFKYFLPEGVVQGDNYVLTIQKQPGIDSEIHQVATPKTSQEVELFKDVELTLEY